LSGSVLRGVLTFQPTQHRLEAVPRAAERGGLADAGGHRVHRRQPRRCCRLAGDLGLQRGDPSVCSAVEFLPGDAVALQRGTHPGDVLIGQRHPLGAATRGIGQRRALMRLTVAHRQLGLPHLRRNVNNTPRSSAGADHQRVLFVVGDPAEAIAKAEELASGPENVVVGDLEEDW